MIPNTIPKKARFVETGNIFVAPFAVGFYTFPATAQDVMLLRPGTTYLIERLSVAGSISEELFLNSLNVVPTLTLKRYINNEILWEKPISVLGYKKNVEVVTYLVSEKEGDKLTLSLSGILNQIADTVGVTSISLTVQFDVYAIDSREFSVAHKIDKVKI